jgi:hypothetical protein
VIAGSEIYIHRTLLSFILNEISRNKVVVPEGVAGFSTINQIISIT